MTPSSIRCRAWLSSWIGRDDLRAAGERLSHRDSKSLAGCRQSEHRGALDEGEHRLLRIEPTEELDITAEPEPLRKLVELGLLAALPPRRHS